MREFIEQIAIAVIISLLGYLGKRFLKFINDTSIKPPKKVDVRKTKKQFFVSLFIFTACAIAACVFDFFCIKILSYTLMFFSFLTLWGAFEAIYTLLEKFDKDKSNDIA